MINGYRVVEREKLIQQGVGHKHDLSAFNSQIINLIPVYPNTTTVTSLAKKVGITRASMEAHLSACEGHALICQDGSHLSRLA